MLVTRPFWEISFLLRAVEIKKLGSKANVKPLIIIKLKIKILKNHNKENNFQIKQVRIFKMRLS